MPLTTLLNKLGIFHIDLFSLDVEGAELEVLRTLDLSTLSIKTLVIEMDNSNKLKDARVLDTVQGHGFVRANANEAGNGYFIHSSFLSLVSTALGRQGMD